MVDLSADNMPPIIFEIRRHHPIRHPRFGCGVLPQKTYDFAKCLYVVAYQQNLHFRQWFKVVEKMG